jgi:anti-sigma factor RsiW
MRRVLCTQHCQMWGDRMSKQMVDMMGNDEQFDTQQNAYDEALMLMSLALDGLLDSQNEVRLREILAADSGLDETWQQWQRMNRLLVSTPRVQPEPGFALRFEQKLDRQLHRARVLNAIIYTTAAMLVWALTVAGLVGIGWLVVTSQAQWMNDFVRELAVYPSALLTWLRAVWTTISVIVGEPQSAALLFGYGLMMMALLGWWFRFLQRNTQLERVS